MNDRGDFVFFSQLLILRHVGANKQAVASAQSQYYLLVLQLYKIPFCLKDVATQTTYKRTKTVRDCNLLSSQ